MSVQDPLSAWAEPAELITHVDHQPCDTRDTPQSTLDGWVPKVGDLVWAQWYSPQRPDYESTIHERIAAGVTYGERRLRIVMYIDGTRWALREPDRDLGPAHREGGDRDWCVLEEHIANSTPIGENK